MILAPQPPTLVGNAPHRSFRADILMPKEWARLLSDSVVASES
jgi:hypothetical protein